MLPFIPQEKEIVSGKISPTDLLKGMMSGVGLGLESCLIQIGTVPITYMIT